MTPTITAVRAVVKASVLHHDRPNRTYQVRWSALGLARVPTVITVRWPRGTEIDFGFVCTDRDPFGEVYSWVYQSPGGTVELRIWND